MITNRRILLGWWLNGRLSVISISFFHWTEKNMQKAHTMYGFFSLFLPSITCSFNHCTNTLSSRKMNWKPVWILSFIIIHLKVLLRSDDNFKKCIFLKRSLSEESRTLLWISIKKRHSAIDKFTNLSRKCIQHLKKKDNSQL